MATDGSIGRLEDFLVDTESWVINYLVVNARKGSRDGHIVIPPEWIEGVNWEEKTIAASFSREAVQSAPQYDPSLDFSAVPETRLHQH